MCLCQSQTVFLDTVLGSQIKNAHINKLIIIRKLCVSKFDTVVAQRTKIKKHFVDI